MNAERGRERFAERLPEAKRRVEPVRRALDGARPVRDILGQDQMRDGAVVRRKGTKRAGDGGRRRRWASALDQIHGHTEDGPEGMFANWTPKVAYQSEGAPLIDIRCSEALDLRWNPPLRTTFACASIERIVHESRRTKALCECKLHVGSDAACCEGCHDDGECHVRMLGAKALEPFADEGIEQPDIRNGDGADHHVIHQPRLSEDIERQLRIVPERILPELVGLIDQPAHDELRQHCYQGHHDERLQERAPEGLAAHHYPFLQRLNQKRDDHSADPVDPVGVIPRVSPDCVVSVHDAERAVHEEAVRDLKPVPHDGEHAEAHDQRPPERPRLWREIAHLGFKREARQVRALRGLELLLLLANVVPHALVHGHFRRPGHGGRAAAAQHDL